MTELRRTIEGEITGLWATLGDNLYSDMDAFAEKLFQENVISKALRRGKQYGDIMDVFVSSMQLFKTLEDFKKHCSKLIHVLAEIHGAAALTGDALKAAWNTAIKDNFGIEFLT